MQSMTVVILTFVLLARPTQAANTTQKDKRLQNVLVAAKIQESPNTPGIGEKAQQEVDELVEMPPPLPARRSQ